MTICGAVSLGRSSSSFVTPLRFLLGAAAIILAHPSSTGLMVVVEAQLDRSPPSAWIEQQQGTKCKDLIPATITIVNDSKTSFDVFWLDKESNSLQQINTAPLEYRQVTPFNSFVNQYMELHERPNPETGECSTSANNNNNDDDNVCRRAFVQIISDVKTESTFLDW